MFIGDGWDGDAIILICLVLIIISRKYSVEILKQNSRQKRDLYNMAKHGRMLLRHKIDT